MQKVNLLVAVVLAVFAVGVVLGDDALPVVNLRVERRQPCSYASPHYRVFFDRETQPGEGESWYIKLRQPYDQGMFLDDARPLGMPLENDCWSKSNAVRTPRCDNCPAAFNIPDKDSEYPIDDGFIQVDTDSYYRFLKKSDYDKDPDAEGYVMVHVNAPGDGWSVTCPDSNAPVLSAEEGLSEEFDPTYPGFPRIQIFVDQEFIDLYGQAGSDEIFKVMNDVNSLFKKYGLKTFTVDDIQYLINADALAPESDADLLLRRFQAMWGDKVQIGGADGAILFTGKDISAEQSGFVGTMCVLSTADYLNLPNWQHAASVSSAIVKMTDASLRDTHARRVKQVAHVLARLLGAGVRPSADVTDIMSDKFDDAVDVQSLVFSCKSIERMMETCHVKKTAVSLSWDDLYHCRVPS